MASRESSSSSTSSSIDLAARVLDLSRILAEIAASDAPVNSAVAIGSQLIRQLARGGICDEEFKYCTDLIQNKAFPNEYGLQLRSKILSSQTKIGKIGGLQCHVYYSIARMMALDDKFCYVVTAVASIMAFHELTFAVECLSNFALGENLDHSHGIQNPYDVRKSRIKPVILEIVKDIAHNIVNAGRELEQLPEELSVPANCNHVVEANVFSAAISTLQKLSGDAVLMTDVLYVDLMLWILNHYHGEIEVAIAGKICFNRSSKRATIKLTFIVRDVCDPATLEHASGLTPHIKISVGKGHFSKPVLDINSEGDQVRGNLSSTTRHELYDIAYLAKPTVKGFWSRGILNSSELMDIEATAQFLCKWLVNVPLVPIDMWNEEPGHGEWKYKGFRAPLSNPQDCSFNIKTLLSRWPDFLRHEYGLKQPLVVFKPLDIPEDIDIVDYTANPSSGPHDFEEIYKVLECFPPVKEVLRGVKQRCKRSECPDCVKDEGHEKFGTGKPGCLVEMAITALFTLVAQVIAEGFGAESASGLQDPTNLKHYVSKLLRELAFHEIVLWDTWLSVAAAVYLGCPWGQIDFDTGSGSGASCTSAVQYGSLIMAANWADITVEQKIERCFGVNFAIGCHLDGVQEDFAVIQCEQSGVQNISDDPTSQRDIAKVDDDPITIQTAITGAAGAPYRHLTIVKSRDYLRIVDPSAVLWNLAHAIKIPNCLHKASIPIPLGHGGYESWTFGELLGGWRPVWPAGSSIMCTLVLDSQAKVNVALCLSAGYSVLRSTDCCLQCALAKAVESPGRRWKAIINSFPPPQMLLLRPPSEKLQITSQ